MADNQPDVTANARQSHPLVAVLGERIRRNIPNDSGNTMFIWLNSNVKELYDRRSGIYSSRHPRPMVERASGEENGLHAIWSRLA